MSLGSKLQFQGPGPESGFVKSFHRVKVHIPLHPLLASNLQNSQEAYNLNKQLLCFPNTVWKKAPDLFQTNYCQNLFITMF